MNAITKFFHQLFNPHCVHCKDDSREAKECPNCEVLRQMLESERFDKKELLTHIIAPREIIKEVPVERKTPVAVPRSGIPWKIRQQMLEREDRHAAELRRQQEQPVEIKSTEQLEEDLGVAK